MEHEINRRLKGYTVRIEALHVHPWAAALEVHDATIVQDADPDPPILSIPRLVTRIDYRALFHGRAVADVAFTRPVVYLDLKHLRAEAAGPVALKDRGWQEALEALTFDLKINRLWVFDGDVTYVDQGPFKPLHLSQLRLGAENIRNVRSRERTYPSEIHLDGAVFENGRVQLDGRADFLAEPHLGVQAALRLEGVELDYLKPITNRYNLSVRDGSLSLEGSVEYAPSVERLILNRALVQGVALDYVHKPQTARIEETRLQQTAKTAQQVAGRSDVELRVDRLDVAKSRIGFVNEAANPPYRIALSDTDLTIEHLTNGAHDGRASLRLRGQLMGQGETRVTATLEPRRGSADADVSAAIERADMGRLNDLVRAYGGFDARAGEFSLYAELHANGGDINGYLKPLFHGLEVGDGASGDGLRHRIYDAMVGAAAKGLRNNPRGDIATVVPISGRVDQPDVGVWTTIGELLRNAFIKEILPGFDPRRSPKGGAAPPPAT
jgi:hypothetical protein